MTHSQTAPQNEGLLPPGSIVELEIYQAVVHLEDEGETHAVTVTCDTLKRMLVIKADALATIFAEHNVQFGTERSYRELVEAFQRQCNHPEPTLWKLEWNKLLDRRLLCVVKVQIV